MSFTVTKKKYTIDKLTEQVKQVLEHSQKSNEMSSDYGVRKLINQFYTNKHQFFKLFPQDSNSDMINFSYTFPEPIEINAPCEPLFKDFLKKVDGRYSYYCIEDIDLKNFKEFVKTQGAIPFFENRVVSDYVYNDKIIKRDMKISRAFKYFIPNDSLLRNIQDLMSEYIQKRKITGYLCVSVHPLDFLSSSMNNHNWRSCHSLDGDFRAGNLSYMTDCSTMICYIKTKENNLIPMFPFPWNDKKWRMLIHVSNSKSMIFFGRQYPMELPGVMDIIAEWLGESFMDKFIKANYWYTPNTTPSWKITNGGYIKSMVTNENNEIEISKEERSKYLCYNNRWVVNTKDMFKEPEESLHYNDILYSTVYCEPYYAILTEKTSEGSEYCYDDDQYFFVGNTVSCPWCGEAILTTDQGMMCCDCRDKYLNNDDNDEEEF